MSLWVLNRQRFRSFMYTLLSAFLFLQCGEDTQKSIVLVQIYAKYPYQPAVFLIFHLNFETTSKPCLFLYMKRRHLAVWRLSGWVYQQCHISKVFVCAVPRWLVVTVCLFLLRFISYPRTETNIFPATLDLSPLVEQQTHSQVWGTFAQRVLDQPGGPNPRQGKNSDQAHPPIHPTKFNNTLQVGPQKQELSWCIYL